MRRNSQPSMALPSDDRRARREIERLIWNDRVDAAMTSIFIAVVMVILADSARVWLKLALAQSRGRSYRVGRRLMWTAPKRGGCMLAPMGI